MQWIQFAEMPNIQPKFYMPTLGKLLGYIAREKPTFKALRSWLKENDLWSKNDMPLVLATLDVELSSKTAPVVPGPFVAKFLEAEGEEQQRLALFARLFELNQLLVKYVLEALDMSQGGRLHSTHELHRMLTSYVYPGKYITLPSFKAWIAWMQASGHIKYVGIRWGLADLGKDAMRKVAMVDVEEFLEEEEEEEEAQRAAEEAAAPPTPVAPPLEAQSVAELSKAMASLEAAEDAVVAPPEATDDGFDEELPDLPPEAPIPEYPLTELEQAPPAEAAPPIESVASSVAPASSPRPEPPVVAAPSVALATPTAAPLVFTAPVEDPVAVAKALTQWWDSAPRPAPVGIGTLGLEVSTTSDPRTVLFTTACLAHLVTRFRAAPGGWHEPVAALVRAGFFEELLADERDMGTILAEHDLFGDTPVLATVGEALFHMLFLRSRLSVSRGIEHQITEAKDAKTALLMLFRQLYRSKATVEPFWVLKEMVRAGVWPPSLGGLTVVPWQDVVWTACRVGLVDTVYPKGFADRYAISAKLSVSLAAHPDPDLLLSEFSRWHGCTFGCTWAPRCPHPCRERWV